MAGQENCGADKGYPIRSCEVTIGSSFAVHRCAPERANTDIFFRERVLPTCLAHWGPYRSRKNMGIIVVTILAFVQAKPCHAAFYENWENMAAPEQHRTILIKHNLTKYCFS